MVSVPFLYRKYIFSIQYIMIDYVFPSTCTCYPSFWKVEAVGSWIQGHFQLYSHCQDILGYIMPYFLLKQKTIGPWDHRTLFSIFHLCIIKNYLCNAFLFATEFIVVDIKQVSAMVLLFSKCCQRKLTLATKMSAPDPGETVHFWAQVEG